MIARDDRRLIWLVPLALAVHNLEEAIGFAWFARRGAMPEAWLQLWQRGPAGAATFHLALAAIVVVVFLVAALGDRDDPRSRSARALLLVQMLMLVNACWHVVASVALGGYAPGVVSAVLVQMPLGCALLSRAWRQRWMSRRAIVVAGIVAISLHAIPAAILVGQGWRGS